MCGFNLQDTHLGVLEQEKFLAVVVECDLGLEVGGVTGDFKDLALAEAVVLDPLADLEIGHRAGTKSVSEILGGSGRFLKASILEAVSDSLGAEAGLRSYLTLPEEP